MSARSRILGRIRAARGAAGTEPGEAELARARSHIARHEAGPRPAAAAAPDLAAHFRAECDRLGTTHAHAPDLAAVPAEVARYLAANGLERRAVLWHALAALDWAGAGIATEDRPAAASDRTGITGCYCAIAETGTVLLLGAPGTPKATALLPENHVCIVSAARLVPAMEDAFALMRAEVGEPPRAAWFVSGPSRTADIEQTLVIGAHGPYRVHVILVP